MSEVIAIIPARGGSKRLPGKNIREFCGKPLLAWTIETATRSGVIDEIFLLTDNQEIAEIGRRYGLEQIFHLPAELADDNSYVGDAVKFFLDTQKQQGKIYKLVVLLEPTAPGRQVEHIKESVMIMNRNHDFDSLVGISQIPTNCGPLKSLILTEQNEVCRFIDKRPLKELNHLTHNIEPTFFINSAVYIFRPNNFEQARSMWGERNYGYLMDNKYAFDINTSEDWLIAEIKMKKIIEEKINNY